MYKPASVVRIRKDGGVDQRGHAAHPWRNTTHTRIVSDKNKRAPRKEWTCPGCGGVDCEFGDCTGGNFGG